jgi:predicted TIM-barrel fold metal-dependent hydrolase
LAIARPTGAELAVSNRAGNDRVLSAGPRFKALATANPWFEAAALNELHRCHELGAIGLYLHPTRQGFMPTDPIAEPLLQFARKINWPVVIHTGTYIQSDVLAVAELARRYPDLTFVCDCAGFTDMWFELPGVIAEIDNLFFCAALIWPRAIGNTVKNVGAHKILFGSGEPRDSLPAALQRIDRLELTDEQRRAIFSENARRIFRLA